MTEDPTTPSTRAAKKAVRTERRALRRELAARRDLPADGDALARHALALVDGLAAAGTPVRTVTLYEATPIEPQTEALTSALHGRGIRVIVPVTLPDLDLDWADVADESRAPMGRHGIHDADLVLTPGLAVDDDGGRLGQGGGCYDKALPRRRPGALVVTLLHPEERTHDPLPREPHDHAVDGVLTADGVERLSPSPA